MYPIRGVIWRIDFMKSFLLSKICFALVFCFAGCSLLPETSSGDFPQKVGEYSRAEAPQLISRGDEPEDHAAEYVSGEKKVWYSVTTFKTEQEAREEFELLKESAELNRQAHKTLFEDSGDEFTRSRNKSNSKDSLLEIRRIEGTKIFLVYSTDHQAAQKFAAQL